MRKQLFQAGDITIKAAHSYMLCGWRTDSEIPLTAVPALMNNEGSRDVVIQVATERSPLRKNAGRFVFQHSVERSLIGIENVADFEIIEGRQIRVWPAVGATHKDIEIFLLGQAWATLCHQRRTLPLHASAIATGKGMTAFTGRSGVGKSTTAALLSSLGYEFIADDILAISFDDNWMPGAWPYLRRVKLHLEPITQLGFKPTEIVSENLDNEKYFVAPKCNGDDKWRGLERLYVLENDATDATVSIEQVTGAEAVRALVDQTYHFTFILGTRRFAEHLEFCTQLASKILVYRLRYSPLNGVRRVLDTLLCAL
jgi:hypothetical protein